MVKRLSALLIFSLLLFSRSDAEITVSLDPPTNQDIALTIPFGIQGVLNNAGKWQYNGLQDNDTIVIKFAIPAGWDSRWVSIFYTGFVPGKFELKVGHNPNNTTTLSSWDNESILGLDGPTNYNGYQGKWDSGWDHIQSEPTFIFVSFKCKTGDPLSYFNIAHLTVETNYLDDTLPVFPDDTGNPPLNVPYSVGDYVTPITSTHSQFSKNGRITHIDSNGNLLVRFIDPVQFISIPYNMVATGVAPSDPDDIDNQNVFLETFSAIASTLDSDDDVPALEGLSALIQLIYEQDGSLTITNDINGEQVIAYKVASMDGEKLLTKTELAEWYQTAGGLQQDISNVRADLQDVTASLNALYYTPEGMAQQTVSEINYQTKQNLDVVITKLDDIATKIPFYGDEISAKLTEFADSLEFPTLEVPGIDSLETALTDLQESLIGGGGVAGETIPITFAEIVLNETLVFDPNQENPLGYVTGYNSSGQRAHIQRIDPMTGEDMGAKYWAYEYELFTTSEDIAETIGLIQTSLDKLDTIATNIQEVSSRVAQNTNDITTVINEGNNIALQTDGRIEDIQNNLIPEFFNYNQTQLNYLNDINLNTGYLPQISTQATTTGNIITNQWDLQNQEYQYILQQGEEEDQKEEDIQAELDSQQELIEARNEQIYEVMEQHKEMLEGIVNELGEGLNSYKGAVTTAGSLFAENFNVNIMMPGEVPGIVGMQAKAWSFLRAGIGLKEGGMNNVPNYNEWSHWIYNIIRLCMAFGFIWAILHMGVNLYETATLAPPSEVVSNATSTPAVQLWVWGSFKVGKFTIMLAIYVMIAGFISSGIAHAGVMEIFKGSLEEIAMQEGRMNKTAQYSLKIIFDFIPLGDLISYLLHYSLAWVWSMASLSFLNEVRRTAS